MFTSVYIRKCDVVIDRRIDNIPIYEDDEDTYIFSFSDTPILSVNDEVMLGDLKGVFKIVHRELEYPQENEPENCDCFWQNLYVIKVKEDYERWGFEKYKGE